mmetsp:Transcript_99289/g.256752  ORF Transcript_99289/g.256752 Transcript_99289/m.256752 type:complete len:259 (+) Transcript_99289:61-837(+)
MALILTSNGLQSIPQEVLPGLLQAWGRPIENAVVVLDACRDYTAGGHTDQMAHKYEGARSAESYAEDYIAGMREDIEVLSMYSSNIACVHFYRLQAIDGVDASPENVEQAVREMITYEGSEATARRSPEELKAIVSNADFIWVCGGCPYGCMVSLRERPELWFEIVHNVRNNRAIYGGRSAGSILAGNELHGFALSILWRANRAATKKEESRALRLLDKMVVPHFGGRGENTVRKDVRGYKGEADEVQIRDGEWKLFY